jgi:hypothetical protein
VVAGANPVSVSVVPRDEGSVDLAAVAVEVVAARTADRLSLRTRLNSQRDAEVEALVALRATAAKMHRSAVLSRSTSVSLLATHGLDRYRPNSGFVGAGLCLRQGQDGGMSALATCG